VAALCPLCRHRHKTHGSGHPKRLNRFAATDGDKLEKYSFEELVAELRLPVQDVLQTLSELQIKGFIIKQADARYVRIAEDA